MKQYKVVKAWGGVEKGQILSTDERGCIVYKKEGVSYEDMCSPSDIALLIHCGFIEEVVEWKPENLKEWDEYWFIDCFGGVFDTRWINDETGKYRLRTNNVFRTKKDAEKRLKEIMG